MNAGSKRRDLSDLNHSNIKNYKIAPSLMEYERGYFASANLTDNKTGKQVYVVG